MNGTNWHFQAYQVDLDLKDANRMCSPLKQRGMPTSHRCECDDRPEDWHSIGLTEDIYLGKEYRKYEFKFQANDTVAKKNRVGFTLGNDKGNVSIKNLTLTEQ